MNLRTLILGTLLASLGGCFGTIERVELEIEERQYKEKI